MNEQFERALEGVLSRQGEDEPARASTLTTFARTVPHRQRRSTSIAGAAFAAVAIGLAIVVVIGTGLPDRRIAGAEASSSIGIEATASPSSEPLPLPSTTVDPSSEPLPSPSTTVDPDPVLQATLGQTLWAVSTEQGWTVGAFDGSSRGTDLPADADVWTAFGHVVAWQRAEESWLVSIVDPATGAATPVGEVPLTSRVVSATVDAAGARVYLTLEAEALDGGVMAMDVDSGATEIVVPADLPDGYRRGAEHWSPSGARLFSPACDYAPELPDFPECLLDVLEIASGERQRITEPFYPFYGSDRHLVGYGEISDGPRPWQLMEIDTRTITTIAERWIHRTEQGFPIGGDHFLVAGADAAREQYHIVLVDAASGEERLLLSQPFDDARLRLRNNLMSERWALLSDLSWEATGAGELRVLDLETGELLPQVIELGT